MQGNKECRDKGGDEEQRNYIKQELSKKHSNYLFAHFRSTRVRKIIYLLYICTHIYIPTQTHIQYIITDYFTIHVLNIFIIIKGSKLYIP